MRLTRLGIAASAALAMQGGCGGGVCVLDWEGHSWCYSDYTEDACLSYEASGTKTFHTEDCASLGYEYTCSTVSNSHYRSRSSCETSCSTTCDH